MASPQSVRVAVRVRPLSNGEHSTSQRDVLQHPTANSVAVCGGGPGSSFTYDDDFPSHVAQSELFAATAAPLLPSFLAGFNVTLLAYGQTGSGKTWSTFGDINDEQLGGIVPRACKQIFAHVDAKGGAAVRLAYVQIYNEKVRQRLGAGSRSGTDARAPLPRADHGPVLSREQ